MLTAGVPVTAGCNTLLDRRTTDPSGDATTEPTSTPTEEPTQTGDAASDAYRPAAKLLPTQGEGGDRFGFSVAMAGDSALIGAPFADTPAGANAGRAAVFHRRGDGWRHAATLVPEDGGADELFGWSVALDDGLGLVGAKGVGRPDTEYPGAAYAFSGQDGAWQQTATLVPDDAVGGDEVGCSVTLTDDTALIGAADTDTAAGNKAGAAYVFERHGDRWQEAATLTPADAASAQQFGRSVAIEANTAVITAPNDSDRQGVGEGAAYMFERTDGEWVEQQRLAPDDEMTWEVFGATLALAEETAVMGSPNDDIGDALSSGSVWVYERTGDGWNLETRLVASDSDDEDLFGSGVAVADDTIVVGAMGNEDPNGRYGGSVYLFERTGGTWRQQEKLAPDDGGSDAQFGRTVTLSDGTILIGADKAADKGAATGAAYVYEG
jgi:hypothetical protein